MRGRGVRPDRDSVQRSTFFLYPRACVVASGGRLTLIPWKHLLYANGSIWTSEGQRFYCGLLEQYEMFEERVWDYSRNSGCRSPWRKSNRAGR